LSKFLFALVFLIPVLLFELSIAIIIDVIFGLLMLSVFSFNLAKEQKAKSWRVVLEHLVIALIVIAIAHYLGDWISLKFA